MRKIAFDFFTISVQNGTLYGSYLGPIPTPIIIAAICVAVVSLLLKRRPWASMSSPLASTERTPDCRPELPADYLPVPCALRPVCRHRWSGELLSDHLGRLQSHRPENALKKRRQMVLRRPDSSFSFANFLRAQLYSTMAALDSEALSPLSTA